jgi:hypothetical protein
MQWWEGQLERRYLLQRAWCIHDAYMTHQEKPTAPVPAFLQVRVAAGQALPQVVAVHPEHEKRAGACATIQATREAGSTEERHAVLAYAVQMLNEQLFTELMQCFPGPKADV